MKRFYLSLVALAAIAALLTAGSLALFSDTATNQGNTFTAGTVNLTDGTQTAIHLNPVAPGDPSQSATYAVTYDGNLAAWLGVTVGITNPDNCFVVTVKDEGLVAYPDGLTVLPVIPGATKTFTITENLPLSAPNSCQGAIAGATIAVKAVQSDNNPLVNGVPVWN